MLETNPDESGNLPLGNPSWGGAATPHMLPPSVLFWNFGLLFRMRCVSTVGIPPTALQNPHDFHPFHCGTICGKPHAHPNTLRTFVRVENCLHKAVQPFPTPGHCKTRPISQVRYRQMSLTFNFQLEAPGKVQVPDTLFHGFGADTCHSPSAAKVCPSNAIAGVPNPTA